MRIRTTSNPSTGFDWQLNADRSKCVEFVDSKYETDASPDIMGAPGVTILNVRAKN